MRWRSFDHCTSHPAVKEAAIQRIASLGIPKGALGRLHEFAVAVAAFTGSLDVRVDVCETIVFCADHGVAEHGVSAFPKTVTRANMKSMVEGVATISVISETLGTRLSVVDIGVDGEPYRPGAAAAKTVEFSDRRIARGTRDILLEPAMTVKQMELAIEVGYEMVMEKSSRVDVFVFGEMGIGNTTSSAAVVSLLFEADVEDTIGYGSGISEEQYERKKRIVLACVERAKRSVGSGNALESLREVGGLEMCGIVGGIMGALSSHKPVILDGLIVMTAYAIVREIVKDSDLGVFAGTHSADRGFSFLCHRCSLKPILNLGMRLGEGTGALLAFPILKVAVTQLRQGITKRKLIGL